MNDEELRDEDRYESYGAKDSGYCFCGKQLDDNKECPICDKDIQTTLG